MKSTILTLYFFLTPIISMTNAQQFIPANDYRIQYHGRWDLSDSAARYSWPGVFITAVFKGKSIGVRLDDNATYFNVFIDGKRVKIFKADKEGMGDYILADNLEDTKHTFRLSKRNISFGGVYSFAGLILDKNGSLLTPAHMPPRRIEFIGNSFTAAESNEAKEQQLPWEERMPVTNIDKGFAPLIAANFNADYITTCRSGSGMVCDWQGNRKNSIPNLYDRTLMESPEPKWNFKKWIPQVVVITLGINDQSGLKDSAGNVSEENSKLFRDEYHKFIARLTSLYPGVKIVAVAAFPEWIKSNVRQVVDEENKSGNKNIFFTWFDEFPGGYVANGHPTVETHKLMAAQLIKSLDNMKLFLKE